MNLRNKLEEQYILKTLQLAQKAAGRTGINPLVGAVVVKNGVVVGKGYHKKEGAPHAEIEALRQAGRQAAGGQLFVNLEPCCHYGKTPPCTDAIIAGGVRKVVVGMRDPNPLVNGRGIRILKRNGIEVAAGVLRNECERVNEVFSKYIRAGVPFVILKTAISLDGKIATRSGESQWISGEPSRKRAHQLRDRVDAVMVGAGTVLKDDPRLTVRLNRKKANHPLRVILDNRHRVPLTAKVFQNAPEQKVIYVAATHLPPARERQLNRMGVDICFVKEKNGKIDLRQLMRLLGKRKVTSLLIEGGGQVNA
ncbi:MAG: bifunctional diaminohydroxyphosphoribosylaminopyrimidine deaminase/5-amino-6-(5-phosphoribosylamino)uracil reductase RibD, partial [Nitrospinales bacterium]